MPTCYRTSSQAYMDAFSECRTVVLASGTLCPTETLKTELGMPFNVSCR